MRTLLKIAGLAAASYVTVFLYRNQPVTIRIQIVKGADTVEAISNMYPPN